MSTSKKKKDTGKNLLAFSTITPPTRKESILLAPKKSSH